MLFFVKQKTAYEMRISDWSSDVCSSDLLRRYMRRLKDHNNGVAAPSPTVDEIEDNAGYTVFDAGNDEDAGDAPAIIAETRVDIPSSSESDAAMMLELRNTTALLFVSSKTRTHKMVYRRDAGTIGWDKQG